MTTVQVTNLDDTSGNSHLTLNNGGNLGVNQTLDTNGNDITSSSGNITLGSALDTSGNNLTDSIGTVTLGSPLDTNGNGIQSDGSVSVDIDADDSGTSETFTVTKDGGATTLLTVNEGGEVDINSGDLDLNGNNVSDSTGDLTFSPRGRFVISGGLSAGSGNNVNIDSSTGELLDATASSVRYKTNIEPLSTDTSAVLDIEPRSYEYEERGEPSVGFIAEKVDETFPDLVIYDEQGRPDGIKYHRLGVYLLPEIRRNRESVDDLRATAEEREERIDDQRDRIERLESTVERKDDRIDTQADRIDDLEAENDRLRERMAAIEARLDGDASGGRGVTADD